jgi:exopolysaccharide biosynthesis protein
MLAALVFALAALNLPAQGPAPGLEVRVAGAWRPWPAFGPGAAAAPAPPLAEATAWRDSAPGLRIGAFEVRTAEGLLRNSVALVEIDPARWRFGLEAAPAWERRSAEDWLRADTGLALAVNTGLFRENGRPIGLVVMDGDRRGTPVSWLDVMVVLENGVPRLASTQAPLNAGASAFQTLPWLVRDGRVALGVTSGVRLSRTHRDRRITLCLGGDGLVRLLLSNFEVFGATVGRVPVGLTIPEQAALAAGAGCRDAVALDGGISAQIAARTGGHLVRMPGWRKVPLMMVLRPR